MSYYYSSNSCCVLVTQYPLTLVWQFVRLTGPNLSSDAVTHTEGPEGRESFAPATIFGPGMFSASGERTFPCAASGTLESLWKANQEGQKEQQASPAAAVEAYLVYIRGSATQAISLPPCYGVIHPLPSTCLVLHTFMPRYTALRVHSTLH